MTASNQTDVLRYTKGRKSQATARKHFINWRCQQIPPIPYRCDNQKCYFYDNPLVWNGIELKLVLDHKNGVCGDNRPKNLQFLCPNCNSQQATHGGSNKGRVVQSTGGFAIIDEDGKKHYTLPCETITFDLPKKTNP